MIDLFMLGVQVVNIILLVGLLYVYGSNYRKLRSKYTAGLMFFVGFMLVETLMAVYFDTSMVMYYSTAAEFNAGLLQMVKAVGLAILLWISME